MNALRNNIKKRQAAAEENRLEALRLYDKGLGVNEILDEMKPRITSIQSVYKYLKDSGADLRKGETEFLVCKLWNEKVEPKNMAAIIKKEIGVTISLNTIYKYLSLNGLSKADRIRHRVLSVVKYRREGKTYDWIIKELDMSLSQARQDFANRRNYTV